MTGRNLAYATDAERLLQSSGHAELSYITAEFEPHSSRGRPDLLFYPREGANAGRLFFVEMRIELPKSGNPPNVVALVEHRASVQEEMPETQLYFAVAVETAATYAEEWPELVSHGIYVLAPIGSGADLASSVLGWSKTALPEPWTPGE